MINRYRLLSEQSRDAFLFFGVDGKFIEVNPAAISLYGYTREELLSKSIFDIRLPGEEEQIKLQIARVASDAFNFETVHRRKDGTTFPVEVSWSETTVDGKREILSIVRDISERKVAEEDLLSSNERMRLANEATGVGIWEWNVSTNEIRWDAEMFRIYGIEPTVSGIVQYIDWSGSVLPEELTEQEAILKKSVENGLNSRRAFRIRRRDDGEIRHVESVETARTDADGKTEWVIGTNLDVTERVQAEVALRRSEQNLADFFENASMGLHWVGADGTILRANRAEMDLLGYDADEYIGRHIAEFHADAPVIEDILTSLTRGETLREYPARLRRKDGSIRDVRINSSVLFEDGQFSHTRCFTRDVTEQRRAEDALRESAQRYRAATAAVSDVLWTNNAEGLMEGEQPGWESFTGQSREEYQGYGWSKAIHPDDAQPTIDAWNQAVAEKRNFIFEHRVRRHDGEWRLCSVRAVPLFNEDGTIREWVGVHADITDRKRVEIELVESRRKLDLAMRLGNIGTWSLDIKTQTVFGDATLNQLFGFDADARPPVDTFFDRIHPDDRDRVSRAVAQAIENDTIYDQEYRIDLPDGSVRWARSYAQNFPSSQGTAKDFTGLTYDVTDRKLREIDGANREAHLRRVINNQLGLVGVIDREGILLEVDERSLAIAKARREEVIGMQFADAPWWNYDPKVAEQMRDAMRRAMAGEVVRYDVSLFEQGDEGVMIDFMIAPVFGSNGAVEYLIPSGVDIRERYAAEQKLKMSEEFNRTVLESSPDCVKVLDGEGRIEYLNANGLCQLEIDDFETLKNEFWWNLWGTENVEKVKKAVKRSLQGETVHFQAFCVTAKGTSKWWDVVVSPVPGTVGEGKRLVTVSRDITEQKRGERQLSFLSEISEDLIRLTSINEIIQTVGSKIGTFLNLSLCGFMEIDEAADEATMTNNWHRADVSTLIGKYRISEFVTAEFQRASRAGEVFVVRDTATDSRADAENFASLNIGAMVTIPILSAGEWRFLLVMFDTKARKWRADEIDLMRELAARIWTCIERRKAEIALRAAHDTFRHLVEKSPFGIYIVDADFRLSQVSAGAQKIFENVRPVIGRDFAEVMHVIWPEKFAGRFIKFFRLTLESGESYRIPSTTERRRDIGISESYDWKLERITLPDGRFGVVCHFYDLSERKRYEAQLQDARDELEIRVAERTEELAKTNAVLLTEISQRKVAEEQKIALLQQVARTQEDERSRIARDLHDQMGQRLTGFRLKLQSLIGLAGDDEEIRSGLLALSEMGQTLDEDVGFLALELRPPMLDESGLEETLAEYVSEWSKRSGIDTVFHSSGFASSVLDPEIEINLYRISQEALNNTAKYAKPTSVNVLLRRTTDSVTLTIEDDGIGFDLTEKKISAPGRGFGLRGMRERASIIGGVLEIESALKNGTRIFVKVPTAFNLITEKLQAHAKVST